MRREYFKGTTQSLSVRLQSTRHLRCRAGIGKRRCRSFVDRSGPSRPRHRSLGCVTFLGSVFWLLAACQASPRVPTQPQATEPALKKADRNTCIALPQAITPPLVPVERRDEVKGQLWLEVEAPVQALIQQLERYLPRRLAREKDRPIGAPGRVSYDVTRSTLRLETSSSRLVLHLPLEIDISICKPIGSACLSYGACTPKYDIQAIVPTELENGEIPPITLTERVVRGCRIGLDVTEHVTRIVKRQLRDAQRRVASRVPSLTPFINDAMSALEKPVEVETDACLALRPKRLFLSKPEINGSRLRLALGARGMIENTQCNATLARPAIPRLETRPLPKSPRLRIPQFFETNEILTSLKSKLDASSRTSLMLTPTSADVSGEKLQFEIDVAGRYCGSAIVTATPGVNEQHITLTQPELISPRVDSELQREITARIEGQLGLIVTSQDWISSDRLAPDLGLLNPILQEIAGLEMKLRAPRPHSTRVRTTRGGLLAISRTDSPFKVDLIASR